MVSLLHWQPSPASWRKFSGRVAGFSCARGKFSPAYAAVSDGPGDEPPIVLYEYQPSRKAKHAEKFLEEFSAYLHADGYQGYYKLPRNIRVVGCWAHARRKFDEALNALLPDKREGTAVLTGLEYCNQLFTWEERFKELSPEDRTKQRLKEEKPILDALLACADSVSAAPKSALGKALHYRKVSPAVSGGRTAGAEQQPGRAQH